MRKAGRCAFSAAAAWMLTAGATAGLVDCDKPANNSERMACVEADLRQSDVKINDVYRQLMGQLDAAGKAQLQREQLAWTSARTRTCVPDDKEPNRERWMQAILQSYEKTICVVRLTQQRVAALDADLKAAQTRQSREAPAPAAAPFAEREQSVRNYLRTFVGNDAEIKATRYVVAFPDLNGDGNPEAIVFLMGRGWCGTGGCTMLVLTREAGPWKLVTTMTVTDPPVLVLTSKSQGWSDIAVSVGGGGGPSGYAELSFDGKTYPSNPTGPRARFSKEAPVGEVVLPQVQSFAQGTPLSDEAQ